MTPAAPTPEEIRSLAEHVLYAAEHEHDACGVGFVVDMKGRRSHKIVTQALTVLRNLMHRGACGCDPGTAEVWSTSWRASRAPAPSGARSSPPTACNF